MTAVPLQDINWIRIAEFLSHRQLRHSAGASNVADGGCVSGIRPHRRHRRGADPKGETRVANRESGQSPDSPKHWKATLNTDVQILGGED